MQIKYFLSIFLLVYTQNVCASLLPQKKNESLWLEKKYRGWFYLETMDHQENNSVNLYDVLKQGDKKQEITDPEQAKEYLKQRKDKLDNLRNLMFANPTHAKYIRLYYLEEEKLYNDIQDYQKSFEKAKYLYPMLFFTEDNQMILQLKRQQQAFENKKILSNFSKKYALYVFLNTKDQTCQQYQNILKYFSQDYNITVYFVDINLADLNKLEEGNTDNLRLFLAKKLGIQTLPATIAISNDQKIFLPISCGLRTQTQLAQEIIIALKYSENIDQKSLENFFGR